MKREGRPHAHRCQRCHAPTACYGELEANDDGFPTVRCLAFHLEGGQVNDEFRCEACQELVDRCDEVPWSRWYANARSEMAFRYGLRSIPKDTYKTEFALGRTVTHAAKAIFEHMNATNDKRLWR